MFLRSVQYWAMLAALLMLAACDTGEPSAPTTAPVYLTEEIPPCTPVPGSSVDPCEPGASFMSSESGSVGLGDAPRGLRFYLDADGQLQVSVAHLVVRGAYLPGTVRCTDNGVRFWLPPYAAGISLKSLSEKTRLNCYADVRVRAYVLGSGPPTLTVLFNYGYSLVDEEMRSVDEYRSSLERVVIEGGHLGRLDVPEGGIEGREVILFVGPSVDASTEAWQVFGSWDVQRREDNTAIAVHPLRDFWRREASYQTFLPMLEMELPAFTEAVAAANQARIAEFGGRTTADEVYPMLVTDANRLSQFFTDVGSYDHPGGPPVQPPPPCGLAVPSQADNLGLTRDCMALLAAKDELRGTGSLNWGTGTTIGSWDGVTTSSDPSGITKLLLSDEDMTGTIPPELGDLLELTHLDLSDNSLTGEIPRELGGLSNLESLKLTGNSLTGCIPTALKSVTTNDLSSLNLLYCPPAPDAPTTGSRGETSVTLSWSAVANAGTYRVEYREARAPVWTVDDDTLTGTAHTVDGLNCEGKHYFRVSPYGDGTTYAAAWSDPSAVLTETTGACVYPDYGASSYSFRVMEDAALDAVVGTVSATDSGGSALSYEIEAGNEDGLFAVGESSGRSRCQPTSAVRLERRLR